MRTGGRHARQAGHHVRVQARAVDQIRRVLGTQVRLDHPPGAVAADAEHPGAGADLTAMAADDVGVRAGDRDVIDDAGRADPQGLETGRVRLDLAQALGTDHLEAGRRIGGAAPMQLLQARQLVGSGGDHHLAADLVGDAVHLGERHHFARPLHRVARLQGPGLVVDAGVDDAAVVTGLMRGEAIFLLQQDGAGRRRGLGQRHGGRQPHDAAADDHHLRFHGHPLSSPQRPNRHKEGRLG